MITMSVTMRKIRIKTRMNKPKIIIIKYKIYNNIININNNYYLY
jgi:hypothetical protein